MNNQPNMRPSRPISYIMLTRGSGTSPRPLASLGGAAALPAVRLPLFGGLTGVQFGEFVVDVLLEHMLIGATHLSPIYKNRGCAVDLELLAVGVAGVNRRRGVGARHAAPEGVGVEAGLRGIVDHLGPGVFGRDDLLVVVNQVVKLPEGVGLLLVRAPAGNRGGARPRMEL